MVRLVDMLRAHWQQYEAQLYSEKLVLRLVRMTQHFESYLGADILHLHVSVWPD